MDVSIKRRIYWSFTLLVSLFVINAISTIITLNNNKKLSRNITTIIDPSLESIENFKDMLVASRMYSTNWVFLRSNQEDKDALKRLHNIEYPRLKVKLNHLSAEWNNKQMADSLNNVLTWFEQVLVVEKGIMSSLQKFDDYDDPVAKLEAERLVEDELLPVTSYLMDGLLGIVSYEVNIRNQKNKALEESSMRLRLLISVLAITIIFIGIFLSLYMARVIISPIKKIRHIVNDLGKGIISQVNHKSGKDEIGEMVNSVNNLSERLHATAKFAQEVGVRNFNIPFQPLSSEDTLGIALISMRDNIKLSDQKLNEAQHIAKLGSWEWDLKNSTLFWSDELFKIFNLDPATFTPSYEAFINFIHPQEKEMVNGFITKCMEDHLPFSYECRIISNDGTLKILFAQGNVSVDERGEIIKMTGIGQDITERKKAEEHLKQSNQRFELVTKATSDVIWDWNLLTNELYCSESYEKLFGHEVAGITPELWAKHIHEDDVKSVWDTLEHEMYISKTGIWQSEYRLIKKDGSVSYVYDRGYIIYDEHKKPIRMVGAMQDITDRKKGEVALLESQKQLSIATQIAKLGYWEFDVKEGLFTFNDQFYSIFKTTAEKVGGYTMSGERFIELFVYPDDRVAVHVEGTNAITSKNPHSSHQFEYRGLYANGEMGHMVNCYFIVKDDQGRTIKTFGANQDITEHKKGEETLLKSEAFLEMKNKELEIKNRELEQFAYVASHDLQEPLRTTSSFADLLQNQYSHKLDEKANKYLGFITHSTDRMKVLIKDLLDYSRIGRQKELEQVDCNVLLSEVLEDLDKLITDENATIQVHPLPVINGYPTEIQQLFQNLIMNAIKFRKKTATPQIKISAQLIHGNWQFAFKDNGIGIEEKHNERIFVIFQRLHTRGEYEGSGIGLSHCKKIVELHGGKIWVNSKPGEGSSFNFTLPAKQGPTNVPGMYINIHENNMKLNSN